MKRSEINRALREMEEFCRRERCYLPPFCSFTPEEWREKGHEYDEVRDCALGWDITDYGLGDFQRVGFSLITIRNGCRERSAEYPKVYAEKLLYLREGQYSPKESDVTVRCDGRRFTVPAGTQIRLRPGESISIPRRLYHDFTVEVGTGAVLLGEVSECNDDKRDNRFNPPVGRFPAIEEDEPPYRLLCGEYPKAE